MDPVSLPSLSAQTFVLAAPVRADEDFTTKERKLNEGGQQLSRYTVAVAGKFGLDQFVIKAPECSGADHLVPLSPIRFDGVTGLFYKPEGGKNLSAVSISAAAAIPVGQEDTKGASKPS